jgi:O-antigen ligase
MLSASRAGAAMTVVAAALYMLLILRGGSRSVIRWTAVGGALVIVLILFVAGGAFLHKVSMLTDTANYNRVVIWKASIAAFLESPWIGWGLGNFGDIYAINQPASLPLPNDKAHSTPLEFLDEVGLLGGVPAFAVCLIPWGACLLAALRQQGRQLPALGFAVAAVPILHSTVDFSLQIPAIGFLVAIFLGMGWSHAFEAPSRGERSVALED